jgi:nicotinamide-nucleotide amidase
MNQIKRAEIICVGTELLLGQIVNTNAAWLARELSLLGLYSYYQTVVGDNMDRLEASIRQAMDRSDVVFLTGGLGPTQDDITMEAASRVSGRPLQLHEPSRAAITKYFRSRGRIAVTANNWKQAMLPKGCIPLPNHNGTAPGAIVPIKKEQTDAFLVLLPGPPSEMNLMFTESVVPWIREQVETRMRHIFIRMIGIGESSAETQLMDLVEKQENPTLAPYASEGEVVFRVTQSMKKNEPDLTGPLVDEIKRRVGSYIYEIGNRTMPEVLRDCLIEKKQTISFAESCTGGLAMSRLTGYPGVSAVLRGGVVAYDNTIKTKMLGVDPSVIDKKGAVSQACALAMASGCRDRMNSDWAVSITGIAGPDGGTAEKPVGTIWVAVKGPGISDSIQLKLAGERNKIRRIATLQAYNLVRRYLVH